jgi:hypothetical protein
MDPEPFETAYREATALVAACQFQQAEAVLQRLRQRESVPSNVDLVLLELTQLYCLMEPPDFSKAETYSLERERVTRTAWSKYATAMMYYWSMVDVSRTLEKSSQAIEQAQKDRDDSTLYSALALKGLALLDNGHLNEAISILDEMAAMVRQSSNIVVGDETLFLERLSKFSELPELRQRIRELAEMLSALCRDPSFTARLEALAKT